MTEKLASYQIRHKEYGYYQGCVQGNPLWYPLYNLPQQGIIQFFNKGYADDEVKLLVSLGEYKKEDLVVEPFQDHIAAGIRLSAHLPIYEC